jgi:hypothetical protein
MGDTGVFYCVWVRQRRPGHADDYQPLGDISGEGATLRGNKVKYGLGANVRLVLAGPATFSVQPHLPLLGGAT